MTSSNVDYVFNLSGSKDQIADTSVFPALKQDGAGMQLITIPPSALLTPHSHPNSAETTYCLQGNGQVGIISPVSPTEAHFQVFPFSAGDMVVLPQGYVHYFMNTETDPDGADLKLLLTFHNPDFDILTFAELENKIPGEIKDAIGYSRDHPKTDPEPIIKYGVPVNGQG